MDKAKFNLYTRIGLVALTALVLGPLAFTILAGLGAGLALIGAAVVVLVLNACVPAFSTFLTALKFRAVKIVVDHAPVEALLGQVEQMWNWLKEQAANLELQATNVNMLKKQCETAIIEFPEEAESLKARLADREKMLAFRIEAFKQSKADTEAFAREVKKAQMFYEIDCKDAELGAISGSTDYMERFKTETAFNAINKKAAQSKAALEMALSGVTAVPTQPQRAIKYDNQNRVQLGNILDVQATAVKVERE